MPGLPFAFSFRLTLAQPCRGPRRSIGGSPAVLVLRRAGSLRERWASSSHETLRRAMREELPEQLCDLG